MSLSSKRLAELQMIIYDCKRFGDAVGSHTLGSVLEALQELLDLKENKKRTGTNRPKSPADDSDNVGQDLHADAFVHPNPPTAIPAHSFIFETKGVSVDAAEASSEIGLGFPPAGKAVVKLVSCATPAVPTAPI